MGATDEATNQPSGRKQNVTRFLDSRYLFIKPDFCVIRTKIKINYDEGTSSLTPSRVAVCKVIVRKSLKQRYL
jgi:hypothetical protein